MPSPSDALGPDLTTAVLAAMDDAARTEILPRWRALTEAEVRTKAGPWDLVTDADVEAERMLTASLRELIDVPVVGEEATAADPGILGLVGTAPACWIVDPVDGTRHFVEGTETFACMIALVEGGRTVGAWITHPTTGTTIDATLGAGTRIDGAAVTVPVRDTSGALRGAVGGPLDEPAGRALLARAQTLGDAAPIRTCAGWDYYDIVRGDTDFLTYTRTAPWDHAPGSLLAREAGLRSARHDGSEYLPGDGRTGLLTAQPAVWQRVSDTLAFNPRG